MYCEKNIDSGMTGEPKVMVVKRVYLHLKWQTACVVRGYSGAKCESECARENFSEIIWKFVTSSNFSDTKLYDFKN